MHPYSVPLVIHLFIFPQFVFCPLWFCLSVFQMSRFHTSRFCKCRATFNAFHRIKLVWLSVITIIKLLALENKSRFFHVFQFGNKLIYVGILTFHLLIFFSHHLQAFFSGYTVYKYQGSKLLAPVVFFADLVKTSL